MMGGSAKNNIFEFKRGGGWVFGGRNRPSAATEIPITALLTLGLFRRQTMQIANKVRDL